MSAEREAPPKRELPRTIPRSLADFPAFEQGKNISEPWSEQQKRSLPPQQLREKRQIDNATGALPTTDDDYLSPGFDSQWLYPPYRINDRRAPPSTGGGADRGLKNISDFTARTDLVQGNGARMYSEHNLYGSRHSIVTRNSLQKRRPNKRPFTVARASFSGTPSSIWLGDNTATWEQYAQTIPQMLALSAVGGVGVVGADTCGFGGNTTETLCARWAWFGAFNTFYRSHNEISSIGQEFYRWPLTTEAGRAAGKVRLQLLDYTYTAVFRHSQDGTPTVWPVSWVHPEHAESIKVETQFYYGPSILVAPVINENSTSVDVWLAPGETFFDYFTLAAVQGNGWQRLDNVGYDTMPLYIRAGSVVPLRKGDAMTTSENAQLPFELVVTPGRDGKATGSLYTDDGESIETDCSDISFHYDGRKLYIKGSYGHPVRIATITIAGQDGGRGSHVNGKDCKTDYDGAKKTLTVEVDLEVDSDCVVELV